jgi:methionyl aminopeptidase
MSKDTIDKKSRHEINLIRSAGQIVGETHQMLRESVKPGMSTWEVDQLAEQYIRKAGAIPTFIGMYGFPATLCISVNDEVVHGIPSKERILQEGDIVSLDCGATYKGLIADSAITIGVGKISEDLQRLLKATEESLFAAIDKMRDGNHLEEVSGRGRVQKIRVRSGAQLRRPRGGAQAS